MQFKAKDKVRVKKNLIPYNVYFMEDGVRFKTFFETMQVYEGRDCEILKATKEYYLLSCDKGWHLWTDAMLEKPGNPEYELRITRDELKIYKNKNLMLCKNHKPFECDTFEDFISGCAALLKEESDDKKCFTGKAVCLLVYDDNLNLTPGKVYEFDRDTLLKDDLGKGMYTDLVYIQDDTFLKGKVMFVELNTYIKYLEDNR